MITENLPGIKEKFDEIRENTKRDKTLQELNNFIKNRFPVVNKLKNKELSTYLPYKD